MRTDTVGTQHKTSDHKKKTRCNKIDKVSLTIYAIILADLTSAKHKYLVSAINIRHPKFLLLTSKSCNILLL